MLVSIQSFLYGDKHDQQSTKEMSAPVGFQRLFTINEKSA